MQFGIFVEFTICIIMRALAQTAIDIADKYLRQI